MSNLPAGFTITSIDGLRCTAVPRSLTTLTGSLASEAATFTTTSSVATITSDTSATNLANPEVQGGSPAALSTTPTPSTTTAPALVSATSTTSSPIVTSTSDVVFISTSTTSPEAISSFTTSASTSALPASKGTTPTTSSSAAPLAVAQSEISASPTTLIPGNNINGPAPQTQTPTVTSVAPLSAGTNTNSEASSASAGLSTTPRVSTAPIVGGVVGSVAFIGIIGFLFFFFRRRRRGRESLLTPLTTGRRSSFYDNDAVSVGPSGRGARWKNNLGYQTDRIRNFSTGIKSGLVGIGASVKSKVAGDRGKSPSVDLNRGNSQFLDGPIPQHSRNNSVLSSNGEKFTLKERATDWFDRIKELSIFHMPFGKKVDEPDPFAAARGMTEKQATVNGQSNVSQLLGIGDLRQGVEHRRATSLNQNIGTLPQLGSFGLDFGSIEDPFADPINAATNNTKSQPWKPNKPAANPFADPTSDPNNPFTNTVSRPEPSIVKPNTYVVDIRRSRGQSMDQTKSYGQPSMYGAPSTVVGSRYPSTIVPNRDSYRDTVFTTFSENVRKGKGRSDPFDLDRPELFSSRENSQNLYPSPLNPSIPQQYTNPLRMSSVKGTSSKANAGKESRIMSTTSYASKYSSGVSSLGDWGEPGPDLGSGSSSMRGNVSTDGSVDGMTRDWDTKRARDNVSPSSSKNGVGKAI